MKNDALIPGFPAPREHLEHITARSKERYESRNAYMRYLIREDMKKHKQRLLDETPRLPY